MRPESTASVIIKGGGFGLLGNIGVGIIGGVVGGFLFRLLAIAAGGLIGSIVTATVGAVALLLLVGIARRSSPPWKAATRRRRGALEQPRSSPFALRLAVSWGGRGGGSDFLAAAAKTPLDVLAVYNDRHSYFLTCITWAENLEAARGEIIRHWGEALYRRFRLYLWASAAAFLNRGMEACRVLLERPQAA